MALEDKDIFNAIFSRNSDQPIEIIMQEYEKAKMLNAELEKRLGGQSCNMGSVAPVMEEGAGPVASGVPTAPVKKRYTRRMLKVKPEEAIGEDVVKCCICGQEGQVITSAHLKKHDITVDEYKKLCRYPKDQSLMSRKREKFTKNLVVRAQNARRAKIEAAKAGE